MGGPSAERSADTQLGLGLLTPRLLRPPTPSCPGGPALGPRSLQRPQCWFSTPWSLSLVPEMSVDAALEDSLCLLGLMQGCLSWCETRSGNLRVWVTRSEKEGRAGV